MDSLILLAQQAGLMSKIENEVKWFMQRSKTGKLLQASSSSPLRESIQEERQLTTADTEGMFLLMGIGYVVGAIALVSEIVGGITNKCRQIIRRSRQSFSSNWSSKRNSAELTRQRKPLNKNEEFARAARDIARKAERIESQNAHHNLFGFGRRQFNLTKSTLRELYGDYRQSEPDYVLRDGCILVENPLHSDVSSLDASTRDSSAAPKSSIVNEKLLITGPSFFNNSVETIVDQFLNEEINNALTSFDRTAVDCHKDCSQKLENLEGAVFGSFIMPQREQYTTLDNLKLFNEQEGCSESDVCSRESIEDETKDVNFINEEINSCERLQNEKTDKKQN